MSVKNKKLRIAHVAPLFVSVPPKKYGGTERVLEWLISKQVDAGHDVTLFASGDSKTKAKLVPVVPKSLWSANEIKIPNVYHTIELDMVDKRAKEFDIIHSHFNFIHFQSIHNIKTPMVTTLHWRVDMKEFQDLYNYFKDVPLVAISNSQKSDIPQANVVSVIYHGLPIENYPYNEKGGDYIAFIGRFSPEKGVHIALEVARKLKMPIKFGVRMPQDEAEEEYYNSQVKPLMDSPLVEYVGELGEKEKCRLLKNARVTLVPTSWPEPFGLVTIESLACGTPVIAYPLGATREIVKDGDVGFLAPSMNEMAKAVKKIDKISRRQCRQYIEDNFTNKKMADDYEKVYRKLI